jgi:hypothetical protein
VPFSKPYLSYAGEPMFTKSTDSSMPGIEGVHVTLYCDQPVTFEGSLQVNITVRSPTDALKSATSRTLIWSSGASLDRLPESDSFGHPERTNKDSVDDGATKKLLFMQRSLLSKSAHHMKSTQTSYKKDAAILPDSRIPTSVNGPDAHRNWFS